MMNYHVVLTTIPKTPLTKPFCADIIPRDMSRVQITSYVFSYEHFSKRLVISGFMLLSGNIRGRPILMLIKAKCGVTARLKQAYSSGSGEEIKTNFVGENITSPQDQNQ